MFQHGHQWLCIALCQFFGVGYFQGEDQKVQVLLADRWKSPLHYLDDPGIRLNHFARNSIIKNQN